MDDLKLTDASVAFGTAGLDKEFTLFKLYTRRLQDNKSGEFGRFDLSCSYPLVEFEVANDPVGLLKAMARQYLKHCVSTTEVPVNYWIIEFSPIMERYHIPSHLFLDTGRDRAWLL